MLIPTFEYEEPKSVAEACGLLAEFGQEARPLAGGTDLMVNMKKGILSPKHVVSLARIETLKKVEVRGSTLKIGAGATVADLGMSQQIKDNAPALGSGARALGSPLIRNLATIGGNISSARPAADLPPSLLVYGARVVLSSTQGDRTVALKEFFQGPGQTLMRPDELLTEIEFEAAGPGAGAGYINLGIRKVQDINVINGASFIALDPKDGSIEKARIALGAVAPTPVRAHNAEKVLLGEKPSADLFARAGQAARDDCSPITDFRGGAAYRQDMVAVVVRRTLETALKQAQP
ncbi:MAG: xanthine dehydrogenase family protein subunit M [Desulfohalobiaceae bacterium]|nr:xanthine dehydrogenase family protein subunit M [Desulfohalobiaceae bacterium]